MCRFYCCLAAHQRTKEMDSAGVPLLYPLDSNSSPWGYPLRRGTLAAAVDRDLGFRYPVQILNPHFDISFGCFVFGL